MLRENVNIRSRTYGSCVNAMWTDVQFFYLYSRPFIDSTLVERILSIKNIKYFFYEKNLSEGSKMQ